MPMLLRHSGVALVEDVRLVQVSVAWAGAAVDGAVPQVAWSDRTEQRTGDPPAGPAPCARDWAASSIVALAVVRAWTVGDQKPGAEVTIPVGTTRTIARSASAPVRPIRVFGWRLQPEERRSGLKTSGEVPEVRWSMTR